jgi:hypothetical protein
LGNNKLKLVFLNGEAAKLAIYFILGVFWTEEYDAGVRFLKFSEFFFETTAQRYIKG